MLDPPTLWYIMEPQKEKKGKKERNENRKGGREEVCSSSHRGLDSYWSNLVYMVVGVMRILVLIKFLNVKFISVKIGDPITCTVTT